MSILKGKTMKNLKFRVQKTMAAMLVASLMTATAACAPVQPAAQPAAEEVAATVAGLEIVSPWARAAAIPSRTRDGRVNFRGARGTKGGEPGTTLDWDAPPCQFL